MSSFNPNLREVVEEQKKTIEKYSNKLRDVVNAHKSLLNEKKALEDTIKILNEAKSAEVQFKTSNFMQSEKDGNDYKTTDLDAKEFKEESSQITSLLTSISNLMAEKSHMEECFKVNQKQLLDEKKDIENKCKILKEEVKSLTKQLKFFENKNHDFFSKKDSKWKSKENNQNPKFKNEVNGRNKDNENLPYKLKNYEREVEDLKSELEAKNIIQELTEKKLKDYNYELSNLQEEVKNLQIEHQSALEIEKEKARIVEDRAKKSTAEQEKRVIGLESKLAELSETIGTYDRLRLQDQFEIQKLKDHISQINLHHKTVEPFSVESEADDYDTIVLKIQKLKKHLKEIAIRTGKEEDFKNLFPDKCIVDASHSLCKEEYNKMKAEFELFKNKVKLSDNKKNEKQVIILQNQVKNLQEKVKVLNDINKNMEKDYLIQIEQLKKALKNEKAKLKEELEISDSDYKGKVWLLEEQLQKQRERSLIMLEEKEQEIQSLQSTFQMFLPGYVPKTESETIKGFSALGNQMSDGPHMIHYANELARRDIEITNLRKKKHKFEMNVWDLQKEIVNIQERHKKEIDSLNDVIARLERCQTREGATLEYLKNVVYNFLLSSDPKSKRHMCNAIAAVLKFSESELKTVINHSKNKWWTKSSYKN